MRVLPVEHWISLTVEQVSSNTAEHSSLFNMVQSFLITGLQSCLWVMVHTWVFTRLQSS